jgi:glutamate-1-semialdehyde 2,1-aminomutase
MTIPGFTSTGSKRPEALFGAADGVPLRMTRAFGCRVWDDRGREYLDTVMALGAVALGYGHPRVSEAAARAARDGVVGPLPPVLEGEVAARLAAALRGVEAVRFLKTGAEAVAAAVRIARVHTGRAHVVTCGYHGWLDWCQGVPGVPEAVRALRTEVGFNDGDALRAALDGPDPVAAVVIEPVVDRAPHPAWLAAARDLTTRAGAVLVFDEIKTAFRIATGGAAEAYGIVPDLTVVGKGLGNGFPIAAVGGSRDLMDAATRTWISSTLATEMVGLAAAATVLDVFATERVVQHLASAGRALWDGLERLGVRYPSVVAGVRGIPQMCFLKWRHDALGSQVVRAAAGRGLVFKRNAYNFVSLAHTAEEVAAVLDRLEEALGSVVTC